MISSYTFKSKLLLEQIKISNSVSSFYNSYGNKIQKLSVKSSSFSNFLDTIFIMDSAPIQYFGEKFENEVRIDTDTDFKSCFFVNSSIVTMGRDYYFSIDSCYFYGKINSQYLISDAKNVNFTHCTFDNVGYIGMNDMTMEYSVFNGYSVYGDIPLKIKDSLNLFYTNFTNSNCYLAIHSYSFHLNNVIFTNNQIKCLLKQDSSGIIANSLFYDNEFNYFHACSNELEELELTISNSCIFVDKFFDVAIYIILTVQIQESCLSLSEEEIRNECSGSQCLYEFSFVDCTFSTNECKEHELSEIALPPKREKFNYKIIGDIEEEFEIDEKFI